MSVTKEKFGILLMTFLFVLPVLLAAGEERQPSTAILVMESSASGITYLLNGKSISKNEGLLLALSRCRDIDARNDPELILIASEKLSFMNVTEVMGIAGKARYFRFRTFVFSKDRRLMYELNYSKPMPFSTNPVVKDAVRPVG
jgi:hypothetical protein